jgi:hypothetical protein
MVVALRKPDPAGGQAVGIDADTVLVMVNGLGGRRFEEVQGAFVDCVCAFQLEVGYSRLGRCAAEAQQD